MTCVLARSYHDLAKAYLESGDVRAAQVSRIMRESAARFSHDVTARHYFDIYESMLRRPLVNAF